MVTETGRSSAGSPGDRGEGDTEGTPIGPAGHTELTVYLHNVPCGRLWSEDGFFWFSYNAAYLSRDDRLPLSLSLPLRSQAVRGRMRELPAYFSNLLPEGWLLEAATRLRIPTESDLDRLLLLCRDGLGAVGFGLAQDPPPAPPGSPQEITDNTTTTLVRPGSERSEADRPPASAHCHGCTQPLPRPGYNANYHEHCARQLYGADEPPFLQLGRDELLAVASAQLREGHAIPGVQEKFSMVYRSDRQTLITPARFIVKPQPERSDLSSMARAEAATTHFAKALGIRVAPSGLLFLRDGTAAFVTRRFDRPLAGGKIHAEDLAQALGKPPERKYDGSVEAVARLIRENPNRTTAERRDDAKQFLQVTLFNFLTGNADGHLKNHSILHERSEQAGPSSWRLAPFYDLFPAKLYAESDPEDLGLSIQGRKGKLARRDFDSLATTLGFRKQDVTFFLKWFRKHRESLIGALEAFGVPKESGRRLTAQIAERFRRLSE